MESPLEQLLRAVVASCGERDDLGFQSATELVGDTLTELRQADEVLMGVLLQGAVQVGATSAARLGCPPAAGCPQ